MVDDYKHETTSFLESAIELMDKDDYVGAIASCSNVINLLSDMSAYDSARSDALFFRGLSKLHLEFFVGAIRDFDNSIKLKSDCPSVFSLRAEAKESLLLWHSALSDYSIALELDPEDSERYFDRAKCKVKMGCFKDAIADFKMAILINPLYSYYEERYKCRKAINDLSGAKKDWDEMNRLRDRGIPKQKISYMQKSFFDENCN